MSRPEKEIDQVLAGLRDAQPSSGLEQRILHALEQRSSRRQRSPKRAWSALTQILPTGAIRAPVWVSGLAIIGLIAIIFAGSMHRSSPSLATPGRAASERVERHGGIGRSIADPAAGLRLQASQAPITVSRPRHTRSSRLSGAASREASLATEEMKAPSLLAPPLPTTTQERALTRVGQRRRPDALAVLNPELRDRQQAKATTEFYSFFDPSQETKSNN